MDGGRSVYRRAATRIATGGGDGIRPVESIAGFLDYRFGVGGISISVGGLVAALVALIVGRWLLSRVINRAFQRYAAQREVRTRAAIYTLSRLAKYALYFVGALLALSFLGIPTTRFAVLAGALGVGLGFGLQAIFSNFISGIIMLFERSLRVGDVVELGSGLHGEVRDINIRATLITTNDNIDILVPNSEFVTGRVVNWTHGDVSRAPSAIPFNVAYGTDKELAKKAALEAAAEVPFTVALEGPRRPQVWLVKFGENSLEFELVVWLTADASKRPGAAKAGYLWALDTALSKYGIEVPYPAARCPPALVVRAERRSALARCFRPTPARAAERGGAARESGAAGAGATAGRSRVLVASTSGLHWRRTTPARKSSAARARTRSGARRRSARRRHSRRRSWSPPTRPPAI